MSVSYSPLESKTGFKSPGFLVDPIGTISTTTLEVETLLINGVPFGGVSGDLEIDGNFIVTEGSTPYLEINNGQVLITNRSDSVGSIENVNIGAVTPGTGTFTSITTSPLGVPKFESNTNLEFFAQTAIVFVVGGVFQGRITAEGLDIPIKNTNIENTVIGSVTPATGTFTEITINTQPTSASSATRKDYVDRKITALAIALGA